MLKWALGFFIVAVGAAGLGFTDIAWDAAEIGKSLFFLVLVSFILFCVTGLIGVRRRRLLVIRIRGAQSPSKRG